MCTAGKTLWRLASAARKIRDSIDKCIPKQSSNVKYVQKKNGSYEKKECKDDDSQEQWEFMKAIEHITDSPSFSTSCNNLTNFMKELRDKARRSTHIFRRRRREETTSKLNGKGQTAIYEMYKFLKDGYEPPGAAVKDPESKELVFDHARQHELMIREWRKVYDQHKANPPSWQDFHQKYGRFTKGIPAPDTLPTAVQLFA